MKRVVILSLFSLLFVGCAPKVDNTYILNNIKRIAEYKPTDEYIKLARSIGDKLIINNEIELSDGNLLSKELIDKIDYQLKIKNDTIESLQYDVFDHGGEVASNVDTDGLVLNTLSPEEIMDMHDEAVEDYTLKLVEEVYYENTTLLKYSNKTSYIIVELTGNSKTGITDFRIIEQ